jgi:hypothetical protein
MPLSVVLQQLEQVQRDMRALREKLDQPKVYFDAERVGLKVREAVSRALEELE